jgi:hypothetical protein
VAERERLTNKERRAQAREQRKREEAEAAKRAKRNQLRNAGITAAIVAVVGAVIFQAVSGGAPSLDDAILVSSEDADAAREAAGCEVTTEREPLPERFHFEPGAAPEADAIYTAERPTHSGPHTPNVNPVGSFSSQVDERTSTHNLEHGSVIVWYDPDDAGDQAGDIADWTELLNANGFEGPANSGAGIISAAYEDPGISSGKAVAFRAWGTAMDCDTFDEDVANAFVIENYGTRGIGPERTFAQYPEGVLEFEDREVDETTEEEAPVEGEEPPELDEDALEEEVGEEDVEDASDELEEGEEAPAPDEEG